MSTLYNLYKTKIVKKILVKFKYTSIMQVPKLNKIVINVGINYKNLNKKNYLNILENLKIITCQKPILTKSKKSISNFKIRTGMAIGYKVTLRRKNM